ncbi:MAG: hypothetical protein J6A83_03340 [Clostridia bacterium]|nr:hypothetical protein [Clostridia bacterium]
MVREEFEVLFARIDDICRRTERGELGVSSFLSPRERFFVEKYLLQRGMSGRYIAYGGYADAERRRVFILPDYIQKAESFSDIEPYIDGSPVCAVRIRGSGYRRLTHRDYLGSVLGLGIEREKLGDIVFEDTEREEALLFCDGVISDFILGELKKVASDTVKVEVAELPPDFEPKRSFAHISDTVASARIDCIVAALCSLSREKASQAVGAGLVEVNFECETRPDRTVSAPALVSVRGYGKFRINSVSEQTRRGRLRLDADKYI